MARALYVCQIRNSSVRRADISQIAVPGGGTTMRGGFAAVSR